MVDRIAAVNPNEVSVLSRPKYRMSQNSHIPNSKRGREGHGILATTDIKLTNMCELAFIEYNPTFDSIMRFPCFFDVTRKTSK
jgi:hypothetical protein